MNLSDDFVEGIVDALREHLGSDLVAVVLYGSWARGTARPGSMGGAVSPIEDSHYRLTLAEGYLAKAEMFFEGALWHDCVCVLII